MLAGIVLGPTVLGRVPGFTKAMFPPASVTIIQVISSFGLCFFMFLVGLELDADKIKKDIKAAVVISAWGLVVPAIGAFLLALLFQDPAYSTTSVGTLGLFLTCALGLSALPVLARILSERRVLTTRLGGISMTIAAVDDVIAWCLLAVVIAIVRAKSQLDILWVFLITIAECLVVFYPIRYLIRYLVVRSKAMTHLSADTFLLLALILIGTSWFTEVIGLSALIGSFQVGLIIPRSSNLSHALSEKLEYFVVAVLMPLYFCNSGLRTQFGLIDDGLSVGLAVLVIVVATVTKIIGISVPCVYLGIPKRISVVIGVLMSCKGLIALIVVNFGYDFGVVTPKFFAILVLMVLVTTMQTVPLVDLVDPPSRAKESALELAAWEASEAKRAAEAAAAAAAHAKAAAAEELHPLGGSGGGGTGGGGSGAMTIAAPDLGAVGGGGGGPFSPALERGGPLAIDVDDVVVIGAARTEEDEETSRIRAAAALAAVIGMPGTVVVPADASSARGGMGLGLSAEAAAEAELAVLRKHLGGDEDDEDAGGEETEGAESVDEGHSSGVRASASTAGLTRRGLLSGGSARASFRRSRVDAAMSQLHLQRTSSAVAVTLLAATGAGGLESVQDVDHSGVVVPPTAARGGGGDAAADRASDAGSVGGRRTGGGPDEVLGDTHAGVGDDEEEENAEEVGEEEVEELLEEGGAGDLDLLESDTLLPGMGAGTGGSSRRLGVQQPPRAAAIARALSSREMVRRSTSGRQIGSGAAPTGSSSLVSPSSGSAGGGGGASSSSSAQRSRSSSNDSKGVVSRSPSTSHPALAAALAAALPPGVEGSAYDDDDDEAAASSTAGTGLAAARPSSDTVAPAVTPTPSPLVAGGSGDVSSTTIAAAVPSFAPAIPPMPLGLPTVDEADESLATLTQNAASSLARIAAAIARDKDFHPGGLAEEAETDAEADGDASQAPAPTAAGAAAEPDAHERTTLEEGGPDAEDIGEPVAHANPQAAAAAAAIAEAAIRSAAPSPALGGLVGPSIPPPDAASAAEEAVSAPSASAQDWDGPAPPAPISTGAGGGLLNSVRRMTRGLSFALTGRAGSDGRGTESDATADDVAIAIATGVTGEGEGDGDADAEGPGTAGGSPPSSPSLAPLHVLVAAPKPPPRRVPLNLIMAVADTSYASGLVSVANMFPPPITPGSVFWGGGGGDDATAYSVLGRERSASAGVAAASGPVGAPPSSHLTLLWLQEDVDMPSNYMNPALTVAELRDSSLAFAMAQSRAADVPSGVDLSVIPTKDPWGEALNEAGRRAADFLLTSYTLPLARATNAPRSLGSAIGAALSGLSSFLHFGGRDKGAAEDGDEASGGGGVGAGVGDTSPASSPILTGAAAVLRHVLTQPMPCGTAILFEHNVGGGGSRVAPLLFGGAGGVGVLGGGGPKCAVLCPFDDASRSAEPALAFLRRTSPADVEVHLLRTAAPAVAAAAVAAPSTSRGAMPDSGNATAESSPALRPLAAHDTPSGDGGAAAASMMLSMPPLRLDRNRSATSVSTGSGWVADAAAAAAGDDEGGMPAADASGSGTISRTISGVDGGSIARVNSQRLGTGRKIRARTGSSGVGAPGTAREAVAPPASSSSAAAATTAAPPAAPRPAIVPAVIAGRGSLKLLSSRATTIVEAVERLVRAQPHAYPLVVLGAQPDPERTVLRQQRAAALAAEEEAGDGAGEDSSSASASSGMASPRMQAMQHPTMRRHASRGAGGGGGGGGGDAALGASILDDAIEDAVQEAVGILEACAPAKIPVLIVVGHSMNASTEDDM
jgi:Kef-type K+ transport system membrane component KefB